MDSREQILNGKGLEVIASHGWSNFRQQLVQVSYADIIERQILQIQGLIARIESQPDFSPEEVRARNLDAKARAEELPRFVSNGPDFDLSKIYSLDGKYHTGMLEDETARARFYVNAQIANSPDLFKAIYSRLRELVANPKHIRYNIDLGISYHNIFNEANQHNVYKDNGVIVSVDISQPEFIDMAARALLEAKNDPASRHLFELPPKYLAHAKLGIVRQLTIPLNDTVALAEMPDNDSYHMGHLPAVKGDLNIDEAESIFRHRKVSQLQYSLDDLKADLEIMCAIADALRQWTPQNTFELQRFPERRTHMPPLVFDITQHRKPQGVYGW